MQENTRGTPGLPRVSFNFEKKNMDKVVKLISSGERMKQIRIGNIYGDH